MGGHGSPRNVSYEYSAKPCRFRVDRIKIVGAHDDARGRPQGSPLRYHLPGLHRDAETVLGQG